MPFDKSAFIPKPGGVIELTSAERIMAKTTREQDRHQLACRHWTEEEIPVLELEKLALEGDRSAVIRLIQLERTLRNGIRDTLNARHADGECDSFMIGELKLRMFDAVAAAVEGL